MESVATKIILFLFLGYSGCHETCLYHCGDVCISSDASCVCGETRFQASDVDQHCCVPETEHCEVFRVGRHSHGVCPAGEVTQQPCNAGLPAVRTVYDETKLTDEERLLIDGYLGLKTNY